MKSSDSLWTRLVKYPPILVRILAKKSHGFPLTTAEIAERAELSVAYTEALSQSLSWDQVPVEHLKKFTQACNLDLTRWNEVKRAEVYLSGKKIKGRRYPPSFQYLKKDPAWETYYLPLILRYRFHQSLSKKSEG